jgi:hypothetical protein
MVSVWPEPPSGTPADARDGTGALAFDGIKRRNRYKSHSRANPEAGPAQTSRLDVSVAEYRNSGVMTFVSLCRRGLPKGSRPTVGSRREYDCIQSGLDLEEG